MNTIWRFYKTDSHGWKWQRLSVSKEVIAESQTAHKTYEGCLADARNKGHVYEPSQNKIASAAHYRFHAK